MRILITGAGSNIGRGAAERLKAAGHALVLSDLSPLPETEVFAGTPFVQCDVRDGFGLERAAAGCDLLLHLPAWHGIHSGQKSEPDYWRLNVDGTFWALQAAKEAGIKRVVFLSSQAWHGHYNKYGFTKRICEELCEYHRRNHGMRYAAVRPADLTPWGSDWVNRYGARLLYGGVDREDVLDCVSASVAALAGEADGGPEGFVVNAVRPNAYTAEQLADWEANPLAACERVFPGSAELVAKYGIRIERLPNLSNYGANDEERVEYRPSRHFGTFLEELRRLDAEGGAETVRALRCPY